MPVRLLFAVLAVLAASCSGPHPMPRSASLAQSDDVLLDIRRSEDLTGAAQHLTLTYHPGDANARLHVSSRRDAHRGFRTRSVVVPLSALRDLLEAARRDGLLQASATLRTCYDCTYFSGVASFDGRVARFWFSETTMPPSTIRALWALAHLPEP